jgi:integrase
VDGGGLQQVAGRTPPDAEGTGVGFARALAEAGVGHARPYDLRHSFASLLLHEGRSVIYVARQLGHGADVTMRIYGHVIEELEDASKLPAEDAIRAARGKLVPTQYPSADAV